MKKTIILFALSLLSSSYATMEEQNENARLWEDEERTD